MPRLHGRSKRFFRRPENFNAPWSLLHVLNFEEWELHFKNMYISAVSYSSTITVVFKSHLDDGVPTYFPHNSQQIPITIFQLYLYRPPVVLNAQTHPRAGQLPFRPITVTFNGTVFPHLAIKC